MYLTTQILNYMKKIIFSLFVFIASLGVSIGVDFPIDFELSSGVVTFNDFGGGEVTVVSNSQSSSVNSSSTVAQMIKQTGETIHIGFKIDL